MSTLAERTPLIVLLAGPNGAGKSTSATRLLHGELAVEEFVNADTIARGLSAYRPEAAAVAAGRVMLERLRFLARERRDFAFETTLAGRTNARWLRELRSAGYRVHVIFLSLPSAELAVARVADRVRQGGHDVPQDVVRRRFAAGIANLFNDYLHVADSWQIYDNSEVTGPRLVAFRAAGGTVVIVHADTWERLRTSSDE